MHVLYSYRSPASFCCCCMTMYSFIQRQSKVRLPGLKLAHCQQRRFFAGREFTAPAPVQTNPCRAGCLAFELRVDSQEALVGLRQDSSEDGTACFVSMLSKETRSPRLSWLALSCVGRARSQRRESSGVISMWCSRVPPLFRLSVAEPER